VLQKETHDCLAVDKIIERRIGMLVVSRTINYLADVVPQKWD